MVPNESGPLYHEVSPLTVRNLNLEVTKVQFKVLFRSFLSGFYCLWVIMAPLNGDPRREMYCALYMYFLDRVIGSTC